MAFCASDLVIVEVEFANVSVSVVIATCATVEFRLITVTSVGTGNATDALAGIVSVRFAPFSTMPVPPSLRTNW